jgi:hypothetical protein
MTPALEVALEALAVRVEAAAQGGQPVTKAQAVAWLRAAGIPRDHARRLVTVGDGRWTVARGPTTARGGCPPWLVIPVGASVSGDTAAAETRSGSAPEPVDLRARLLAAARAAGFRRLEYVSGRIIPTGEAHWQRFAGLADQGEVVRALRALGVAVDAEDSTP